MSAQHTPGPWMAGPMVGESDTIWIGNGDGYVAQVTRIDGLEPIDWADAALIAAAPDLLAACQAVLDEFPAADGRRIESVKAICRAAITKATAHD
jgi:hypothetical protein